MLKNFNTDLFIPSRNRAHIKGTYNQLPPELQNLVKFCVWEFDPQLKDYLDLYPGKVCIIPELKNNSISEKRSYIAANLVTADKFVFLDDDLNFFVRNNPQDGKAGARKSTDQDILQGFQLLDSCLDSYAHAGFATRQGNPYTKEYEINTRCIRVTGFRTSEYNSIEHNRIPILEDFDATLQLIERGYPNIVLGAFMSNEIGTSTQGGCNDTRTVENHNQSVEIFKTLHPDVVRIKLVSYKYGGERSQRKEVTIQWKKAYKIYEKSLS